MEKFANQAKFSLCHAMTGLLAMGVSVESIIPMVTSNCAAMLGMEDELGSLEVGRAADISVLNVESGDWDLRDNGQVTVKTDRRFTPAFCLRAGERFDADAPILPN
jgi:dihydroorotase